MQPLPGMWSTTQAKSQVITIQDEDILDLGMHGVPYQGPIYFNDDVAPDPTLSSTSFDGGVLYTSLPTGSIELFATKEGFTYESVKFLVEPEYNV